MDQEIAKKISLESGLLILENLPLHSEFCIDCKSYQIGEKFKGLKMIPKGLHFISFRMVSNDGQMGPKTGFFHFFKNKETVIKIFDLQSEKFSDEPVPNDIINKYKIQNFPYFDQHLGPYPFEQFKKWISLTDLISENLMEKINSNSKLVQSVSAIIPKKFISTRNQMDCDSFKNDLNDLNFELDEKCLLNFTKINQLQAYRTNATAAEITRDKIDNSYMLEQLIEKHGNVDDVLGELQLAFVVFFIGQNYDAFEQWKQLFQLICKSSTAMRTRPQLFVNFSRAIYFQLKEVPADIFIDILENNNFLLNCLRDFFLNIYNQEEQLDKNLVDKSKKLHNFLNKQYNWEFDIEPEDEAPVVVELD